MRSLLFAAIAALSLAGCASLPDTDEEVAADPADSFLGDLSRFTANDLDTAIVLAESDPIAKQCYVYLRGKVGSGSGDSVEIKGLVSAYQSARNVRRRIGDGPSDEFTLACGPLITDARRNLLKVAGRIGSGGILPF